MSTPYLVNKLSEDLAIVVLSDDEHLVAVKKITEKEKKKLHRALVKFKNVKVFNSVGNFLLCKLTDKSSAFELLDKLIEQGIKITVPDHPIEKF